MPIMTLQNINILQNEAPVFLNPTNFLV